MKTISIILLFISLVTMNTFAQSNSKMDINPNTSTEIIRYKISSDDRENLINAYSLAAKHLQSSEYCLGYELIEGEEEPNNFIVIIYWTSMNDHLQGFRKSATFGPFFNLVKPFYNNIEEMKHYNFKLKWERTK